jgi:peptide/nickel transport system substrate-binding protein
VKHLLLVIATWLAFFGTSGAQNAQSQNAPGETLHVGLYSEFRGFDIAKVKVLDPNTLNVATAIMEPLFEYVYDGTSDATGRIVPRLALTFEEAPDRLSAIVHLRDGVKFHDGTPFNAAAVVYHFSRILDPALGLGLAETILEPLERVEAVDPLTVKFVLKRPWASLQSALAISGSMNLIGSPTALAKDPDGFNRHPVGTGPFVFHEWKTGDRLVVDRNPEYWDSALPKVNRVVYRIMPDGNTRYESLKAGELDVMWTDDVGQVNEARKNPDLVIHEFAGASGVGWIFNNSKPPFDDARVRAAVVHAFNSAALAEIFFQGGAKPSHEFFPNSPWSCPDLKWRSFDPTEAKRLLKEVGKPIKVTLTGATTPDGRRMNSIAQQFMTEAGIDTKIETIESSQIGARAIRGGYEMLQWRFPDVGGEPDLTFGQFTFTATKYRAPQIDMLIGQARNSPDQEERRKIYCKVSQIFSDEAILLLPVNTIDYLIGRKTVISLPPDQAHRIRVRDVTMKD